MSRATRVACALAIAATGVGVPGAGAKVCAQPVRVAYSHGWTETRWPAFADPDPGGATIGTVLAIDPTAPNTLYASDGISLLATTDGGCTWSTRFTVTEAKTGGLAVSRILVAPVPNRRPLVYLVLDTPEFGGSRTSTALLRSDDGAKTFVRADVGLPWAGTGAATAINPGDEQETDVTVAPSDGRVLYVRSPTTGGLWASDDAGATWTLRHPVLVTDWDVSLPVDVQHDKSFQCCTVDPLAPHDIWGTNDYGVVHSVDGGKTFTVSVNPGHHIVMRSQLVATHRRGSPALVAFQRADDYTVWGTRDGGRHWGPQFGGQPVRWELRDPLGLTATGLLAFATEDTSVKLLQLRNSRGYVAESDVSGGWFRRYITGTAATSGSKVYVAVVEWGYTTSAPLIERRTFALS